MNKFKLLSALVILAASHSVFAADGGGIAVGATRVIYDAGGREAALSVINRNTTQYFLIQSWVDDKDGNKKVPFSITPPLFRLNGNKENVLRIIKTAGDLPADHESVFWVNVKAIPPAPEDGAQNVLQLAIKTRVKLFYRPKGLPGTPEDAPKTLEWHQQGSDLVVKNNSAYSVSFNNLSVDNKDIKEANLVPAREEVHYKLPNGAHASKVAFKYINDFGGIAPEMTASVK